MLTRSELRFSAWAAAIAVVAALGLAGTLHASKGEEKPEGAPAGNGAEAQARPEDQAAGLYNEGLKLANGGDYEKARDFFERANRLKKNDPDILNMLAFTERQTGHIDDAFENYRKALKLQPRFPRAHEYLAEAYLQAALQELQTLKSFGADGQADAQKLVEAMKETAATASGEKSDASSKPHSTLKNW